MDKNRFFSERNAAGFIILCGFLLRLIHLYSTGWIGPEGSGLLGMRMKPYSPLHFSDADAYDMIATGFLAGNGFNIPFTPPFTVWLLSAFYKVWGHDPFAAKIFFALLDTAALFFVWRIARDILGEVAGIFSLLLSASSFTLIFITGGLNTEPVYMFTLSLAVWLFLALYRRAGERPWALSFLFGTASAAAMLTRSEFALVLAGFLAMGFFRKDVPSKTKAGIVSAALAGFILLVGPWTVRNYFFMSDLNRAFPQADLPVFVPVALNGPFNFLEGHNPGATGSYAPDLQGGAVGGYHFNLDPTDPRHMEMVRDGYSMGLSYILRNPGKELSLIPVKVGVFLSGMKNGFYLTNFPAGIEGEVPNMADSFSDRGWLWPVAFSLMYGAGVYRLWLIRENGPRVFIPLFPPLAVLFVSVVFYSLSRMVFPVLPFVYMVASAGLAHAWTKFHLPKATAAAVLAAAVLLLLGVYHGSGFTVLKKSEPGRLGGYSITLVETAR